MSRAVDLPPDKPSDQQQQASGRSVMLACAFEIDQTPLEKYRRDNTSVLLLGSGVVLSLAAFCGIGVLPTVNPTNSFLRPLIIILALTGLLGGIFLAVSGLSERQFAKLARAIRKFKPIFLMLVWAIIVMLAVTSVAAAVVYSPSIGFESPETRSTALSLFYSCSLGAMGLAVLLRTIPPSPMTLENSRFDRWAYRFRFFIWGLIVVMAVATGIVFVSFTGAEVIAGITGGLTLALIGWARTSSADVNARFEKLREHIDELCVLTASPGCPSATEAIRSHLLGLERTLEIRPGGASRGAALSADWALGLVIQYANARLARLDEVRTTLEQQWTFNGLASRSNKELLILLHPFVRELRTRANSSH